jgi:ParB family chromosome partitioning protein
MVLEKIEVVKLDQIDRPAKIAREAIDPEKVRELAESIREVGLLEPVLLRPSNGRFEMVAGDRRYLAHKLLGLKDIKAIVRKLNDQETVLVRAIENLQRENLTPSEEGRFYTSLKEEGGLSIREICRRTGKTDKTVMRLMWFSKFPEDVRRAVDLKQVSLNVLEILAEVEDETMFKYFFDMAVGSGISSNVARLWVDDYLKTKAGTFYAEGGGSRSGSVPTEVKPVFMTCECCHDPVAIGKVRNVIACPKCVERIVKRGNG